MSQKHKRRIDDDKRQSSRVNVFERLGDSKKDRGNWSAHPPHKNNRSNVERYEGNHGGRMPERWPSSGRVPDRALPVQQTSPTKVMKSRRMDYVDPPAFKQDRRRYDDEQQHHPAKHHRHMEAAPLKHRQPSLEVVRDDFDRKRKRKPISPVASASGSSVSPIRSKREAKRSKYQSPSPPPPIRKEKQEQRGRSKERKSKKIKEVTKTKEHLKSSKTSKSYDQYPEATEYKSSERQYKREESYDQMKYHKEQFIEHHKEKKRLSDRSESPMKKSRAIPRDMELSEPEERRKHRDSSGKSSQHRKTIKTEPVYESDEAITQRKKSKSSKVEPVIVEETKRKKKIKSEREEPEIRYSSKGSSSEYVSREKRKKPKEEVVYEDVRASQPTSTKHREAKYTTSEFDSLDEPERKSKTKKKKKIVKEIPVPVVEIKKKKSKQKIEEPIKKKSSKVYEKEIREKPKIVKKKKKLREPSLTPSSSSSNTSSESDSESEPELLPSKKQHHSASLDSWEAEAVPDVSPEPSYSKRSSYGSGKDRSISVEVEPKRKRAKMEISQRPTPETETSSRYRQASPNRSQYGKRQEERSFERQSYSYEKESKRMRDDEARDDRRLRTSEIPQKRFDRHPDYIDPKEPPPPPPPVARYDRSPPPDEARYTKRHPEEKFYDKNYSRYDEKSQPTSYDDKRNYARRNQGFQEKKAHHEDRRDARGDSYPAEEQRRDSYPTPHVPQHLHRKQSQYPNEHRSGELRGMKEPRHPDWEMERVKKHKDPVPGYSGGMQRNSSWMDGRDASKMRVEPPGHRGAQQPPRMEDRNYRMPRNDNRSSRKEVQEMRGGRPESRERPQMRGAPRNQPQEKWGPDRRPYENPDMRRGGGRYGDDRNRPQEGLRFSAERGSPSFFREVRRSGENLHNDLKIEVTIGGRPGQTYEKNKTVKRSPVRKVSSYEVAKARERAGGNKIQADRNNSLSRDRGNVDRDRGNVERDRGNVERDRGNMDRDRGNVERDRGNVDRDRGNVDRDRGNMDNMSYKRPTSAHTKQSSSKYQQHGSRDFPDQPRDFNNNREYSRGRIDAKPQDANKGRKKDEKFYKKGSARPESDRSRDSSAVDRVRSRDNSAVGRDRSRDKSRQSSRDRSRRDASRSGARPEHSSRKSKSYKETSKESSDRRRKRTETSEKKSRDENAVKEEKKEKEAPEAAGVLDVDWTEISTEKKAPTQLDSNSILNRFNPGSVLLRMGVSSKLLPPELLKDVKKKCEEEATKEDDLPLVLNQELGALNRAESLRQWSWSNAFSSKTSRLTSYADAEYRQKLLSITQNMLYPPQPPVIINAKSYASSVKHYLNKTKIAVGGA